MTDKRNCTVCGAENTSEFEFCIECGAKLPRLQQKPIVSQPQPVVTANATAQNSQKRAAIFCTNCGFGAESGDRYCNQCGAPLFANSQQPRSAPTNNYTYYNMYSETDLGVDETDLREFIGPNAESYVNKFKKMKRSGSKTSWNWPAFLFSFLLNLPYVWFFYRKMYKVGSILLAVSVVINILSSFLVIGYITPIVTYSNNYVAEFEESLEQAYENDEYYYYEDYEEYLDEYYNNTLNDSFEFMNEAIPYLGALALLSMGQQALTVIISIFANNMYFNHCVKKIKSIPNIEKRQRSFLLFRAGGTSTGAAVALGILVPIICAVINGVLILSAIMAIF